MDDDTKVMDKPVHRAGSPWASEEDDRLVRGLADGLTVEALAEAHGRTVSAVRGRVARMAPPDDDDVPAGRTARVQWVRDRLVTDPGYDWRAVLHASLSPYQRPWTAEEDAEARAGWESRRPLPEFAAAFGVEEHVMARRLVQLGLADGIVEVTDRLGCTPGSVTAVRRALALDAARTRVLVLVVVADGTLLHVSLHADDTDALHVRDRVVAGQRETGRRVTLDWTLTNRQVEDIEPSSGATVSGRTVVQGDTSSD